PDLPQSSQDLKSQDTMFQMIEALNKSVEGLKEHVTDLETENATLKEWVTDLRTETTQLRLASHGNLEALRALRRRIRLDEARKLILAAWSPNNPDVCWNHFSAVYSTPAQMQVFISSSQVFRRPLTAEALDQVFHMHASIRAGGNFVAHEADQDLLRDAIEHATPYDMRALTTVWESVYNKDF
ncbi:hypothetical protein H0H81_003130, partial [Sphagnurus paluster]